MLLLCATYLELQPMTDDVRRLH